MLKKVPAACILLAASLAQAQLNLGSQGVSKENIDAYMAPFYRLVAAGIGAGRFLPPQGDSRLQAGLEAGFVPMPSGNPFREVDLAGLPLFRARVGYRLAGITAMFRGMGWRDPRIGSHAVYGGGLGYLTEAPAGDLPLSAGIQAGWDHLDFSSAYTYHYPGVVVGLGSQDVPGDYTLGENLFGLSAAVSLGRTAWKGYLEGSLEKAFGRFQYLYVDPADRKNKEIRSDLDLLGWRLVAGGGWRGLRLEGGYHHYPYFSAGWTWNR